MACPHCTPDFNKRLTTLTPRQKQVMGLVCQGLTNKQIAAKLFVEEKTIKFHVTAILKKRNCKTRYALMSKEARVIQPEMQHA